MEHLTAALAPPVDRAVDALSAKLLITKGFRALKVDVGSVAPAPGHPTGRRQASRDVNQEA